MVRMQNLGVRDTRNIFGIQLLDGKEKVSICLPYTKNLEEILKGEEYLNSIQYKNGYLIFSEPVPMEMTLKECNQTIEKGFVGQVDVHVCSQISLCMLAGSQELVRKMEIAEQIKPILLKKDQSFFEYIANADAEKNHEAQKFTIYPMLARHAVGIRRSQDQEELLKQLELLDSRIDCADFIANGLLRFMHCYGLPEQVCVRAKEVLLNFRFWMDEAGEDGMCFWSENHSLLFYSSLLLTAQLYPDDVFIRSGRTGKEQYAIAEIKVNEWLDDVNTHGFEEFLSGGYTVVTVAALLNLVDFTLDEISQKAVKAIDKILTMLAKHTYKGTVIAPEGRIYRDVIYPFSQGVQALIHYINPEYPVTDNIWLAAFATTKYQIPECLKELMEQGCQEVYETGNALVTLNKKQDYILTSVASPRADDFTPWYHNSFDVDVDRGSVRYTKSMNERFHGTTCFQPGVYGYQQHLWYAALDSECIVFTNHPGENTDRSSMRPAYWYGNGIFPAVKQNGSCIGIIYQIPEHYPIHFTHLYLPECKFDEVRKEGKWIFAKKKEGYLSVWSNQELEPYDDLLFDCEYRSYGDVSAYFCMCGSANEYGDFDQFINSCKELDLEFNTKNLRLTVEDKLEVCFKVHHNRTQYI